MAAQKWPMQWQDDVPITKAARKKRLAEGEQWTMEELTQHASAGDAEAMMALQYAVMMQSMDPAGALVDPNTLASSCMASIQAMQAQTEAAGTLVERQLKDLPPKTEPPAKATASSSSSAPAAAGDPATAHLPPAIRAMMAKNKLKVGQNESAGGSSSSVSAVKSLEDAPQEPPQKMAKVSPTTGEAGLSIEELLAREAMAESREQDINQVNGAQIPPAVTTASTSVITGVHPASSSNIPKMMSADDFEKQMSFYNPARAKLWLEKEAAAFAASMPVKPPPREICKHHFSSYGCSFGDRCMYSHGDGQYADINPDLLPGGASSGGWEKTNIACKNFAAGMCRRGENCCFSHDPAMHEPTPLEKKVAEACAFFDEGKCTRGVTCPFAHGQAELSIVLSLKAQKDAEWKAWREAEWARWEAEKAGKPDW